MAIIGSASVQIRALDNLFQGDVKKAVEKIKDVSIKIVADFDDNGVQEKLNKVRRSAEADAIDLRATADVSVAQKDLDHLYSTQNGRTVEMNATAQTTDAAAQLNYTARSRIASIYPVVNGGALATAKAILESLSGVNTLRSLKDTLKSLATGFDTASVKAIVFSSAILSLIGSLGSLTASVFAIGDGISQLVGFFALAPTLIGAMTTVLVANHLAWNNFADAMSSNATKSAKALALLPATARTAAVETKKLWNQIKEPVQGAFWEKMGPSLQNTLGMMAPALTKGLKGTAESLGTFTSNALTSFQKISENKTLDGMFTNLNGGIDALSRGIAPLLNAFNTLGFVGSQYLPQLGNWLSDLAVRFDNFITKSGENGDIVRWVEEAKMAMEDLWRASDGLIGIAKGLNTAFQAAGAQGLDEMATSLLKVEEIIKGPVFQSQFAQIMGGMIQGAHAVKEGFEDVGRAMGDSSIVFGQIFTLAGGVIKELLSGVSALISVEGFQVGLIKAFGAIKNGLDSITPSFENLGEIMGTLLEIASVIFTSIAPVINNATELVAGALDNVKQGFMDVIPVLMGFVNSLITAFSGPILTVSKIIGDIITGFTNLPGPIQTALMALGLVLLLLPKITKAISDMRNGMRLAADGANGAKDRFRWMNDVGTWARTGADGVNKAFGNLKYETAFGGLLAKDAFRDLRTAGSMAMGGFVGGIRSGIGALAFVGSEIGTAVSKSFGQVSGVVAGVVSKAAETIKRAATTIAPYAKEFGTGLLNGFAWGQLDRIKDGFRNVGQTITGMVDTAKWNLQGIAVTAGTMASLTRTHFGDMVKSVGNFANLAKAYIGDFGKSGGGFFSQLRNDARNFADVSKAYVGSAFQAIARETQPLRNSLGHVWDDFYASTNYMEKRVRDTFTAVGNAGRVVGDGVRSIGDSMGQMASYTAARFEPLTRTFQNTISGAARLSTTAFQGVVSTLSAAGQNIAGNFAPVGAAFRAMGDSARAGASNIRIHTGNIVSAMGTIASSTGPAISAIGRVTGAIGSAGKSGLGLAVSGLVGALGGGWGIAIMGATALIAGFGAAQEKVKSDIDGLSGSLDKQSGAVTAATSDMAADMLSRKKTFLGMWDIGESPLTYAKELNVSTEMITKAAAGNLEAGQQLAQWEEKFNAARFGGTEAWKAYADANGLSNVKLSEANTLWAEVGPAVEAIQGKLQAAQQKIIDVATATGKNTTQAAMLSANYETLVSKTSSASDKFNALKANLDILNDRQMTATNSTKAYHQTVSDAGKAITELNGVNKDQIKGLVDVAGQIDLTKQAGRDFHTVLETQADSILNLGATTLDNAVKNGKSAADAQKAAMEAMNPAVQGLQKTLHDIGLEQPQIDAILRSFGLMPDQLAMAVNVEGKEQAMQDIRLLELAGKAFSTGNYEAVLSALPQAAKDAIASATGTAQEFKDGNWEAILKVLDSTAGGREAAIASILTATGGDWNAVIKALNLTGPQVDAAKAKIAEAQGKSLPITATDGVTGPVGRMQGTINGMRGKTVEILTLFRTQGTPQAPAYAGPMARPLTGPGSFDGSLIRSVTNAASLFSGKFPMKSFANGGFENHVAQISRGQTPFRVWSEPETGGEAYIPLSLSKRKRSKEILEMVARQFGFGLVQMFADGGFSNAVSGGSSSPGTGMSSSSTPSMQMPSGPLVAVYPSAALDEEKVGTYAARQLWFDLQNK